LAEVKNKENKIDEVCIVDVYISAKYSK